MIIPLLVDELKDDDYDHYVQPLPSTHLPDEMTTLNVYHVQAAIPLHQAIIEHAMTHGKDWIGEGLERTFGHVAWKPSSSDKSSLVGAIGCATEVLVAPWDDKDDDNDIEEAHHKTGSSGSNDRGEGPVVLCRGTYRFIVREIKQSCPFPIAVVDELADDLRWMETSFDTKQHTTENDEDDNDDHDYTQLSPMELVQRTMQAMQAHVEQQLEMSVHEMSPMERSLVENNEGNFSAQRSAALEMATVWDVFQQYLLDLCPSPMERCFTIGFMAAEMANLPNNLRSKILRTTNGLERLRIVLQELETTVGMTRARKMAHSITHPVNEGETARQDNIADNQPSAFPAWVSRTLKQGVRVEYFWDDEVEWRKGTVVDDPVFVVTEYVMTIKFDDSHEVHKLAVEPREKERWRLERPF